MTHSTLSPRNSCTWKDRKARFYQAGLLSLALAASSLTSALALDAAPTMSGVSDTEELTRQILLDEVALEKFNLHYRLNSARQGRWKGLRYFGLQELNFGATESGLITAISERGRHIHAKEVTKNSANVLSNGGALPQAIGQTIGAGADALELGINGWHKLQASKDGFSAKQARSYATNLVSKINHELSERDALVRQEPEEKAKLDELEGSVLKDFRNVSAAEFEHFQIYARKTMAQQQAFYFLDCTKNVTGAVGTFIAYRAIALHRRVLNCPAGIMTCISGGFIAVDPILSRLVANEVAKIQEHNLKKSGLDYQYAQAANLQSNCQALRDYCRANDVQQDSALSQRITRLAVYEEATKQTADTIDRNAHELSRGNRIAIQNMGSGIFVGATKEGLGIPLTVAGVKYHHDRVVSNSLLFSGSVSYLCGTTYSLLDSARIQARNEIEHHRLAKNHELPEEIIEKRLDRLETLEKQL